MIRVNTTPSERLCQGDILSNVELIEYANIDENGIVNISKISFPFAIVLTQDCDLEQDFNNRNTEKNTNQDKHILSVIVAPLYNIEHIYNGEHLSELDFKMQIINSRPAKSENRLLRQNQNPRYHYLQFDNVIPIVNSVIDFKHYFTVNNEGLKKHKQSNFICKVEELFREQISLRFSNYLSRIGLPD
jgi:hypothetical protein